MELSRRKLLQLSAVSLLAAQTGALAAVAEPVALAGLPSVSAPRWRLVGDGTWAGTKLLTAAGAIHNLSDWALTCSLPLQAGGRFCGPGQLAVGFDWCWLPNERELPPGVDELQIELRQAERVASCARSAGEFELLACDPAVGYWTAAGQLCQPVDVELELFWDMDVPADQHSLRLYAWTSCRRYKYC